MTLDLGARRPRRTFGQKLSFGLAGLACVALPLWLLGRDYLEDRGVALNTAAEWKIDGPPCRQVTAAEFVAEGRKLRAGAIYEDVAFVRQYGHMSCASLRYGGGWGTAVYPVCQFTSPHGLKITTDKGDWYFAIEPGQPATVATPHGQARCVLAANFTMQRLLQRAAP
jgi:hypothetical protein